MSLSRYSAPGQDNSAIIDRDSLLMRAAVCVTATLRPASGIAIAQLRAIFRRGASALGPAVSQL